MEATHLVRSAGLQPLPNALRSHQSKLLLVHCGTSRQIVDSLSLGGICRQPESLFLSSAFVPTRDCTQPFLCAYTSTVGGQIAVEETFTGAGVENESSQHVAEEERHLHDHPLVVVMENIDSSSSILSVTPSQHERIRPPRVSLDALIPGAVFPGRITNIKEFGAFVDLGAFTSGLVHISNVRKSRVQAVKDVVHVGQQVMVKVLSVNVDAKRIRLMLVSESESQKDEPAACDLQGSGCQEQVNATPQLSQVYKVCLDSLNPGGIFTGKVTRIETYGAFVNIGAFSGLIHKKNMGKGFVRAVEDVVKVGEEVKVELLSVDAEARRFCLRLLSRCEEPKVEELVDGPQLIERKHLQQIDTMDGDGSMDASENTGRSTTRISQDLKEYKVSLDELKAGAVFPGRVTRIERFGAFVALGAFTSGLIHKTNLRNGYVQAVEDVVQVGQVVNVEILGVDADAKRIYLKLVNEGKQPVEKQLLHENYQHLDAMEEDLIQNKQETVNVLEDTEWSTEKHLKEYKVGSEDLKPGAVFTGKVTNIQSYGAFVDIGAFNSGLLHIKNLRKSYVRAVEDVVQLGQEVVVEVLSVDVDAKHIFLRLKSENTHFQKGEIVKGVVKKKAMGGFVIGLQDGHEGFLPASEVLSGGVVPDSYFKINQEIPVRILRTTKSNIMLTMKTKDELKQMDEKYISQDTERATSPFEIAFHRDVEMAKYLEERHRLQGINDGEVVDSTIVA